MGRWCLLNKEWIGCNFTTEKDICPYSCNACGLKNHIPPKSFESLGGYNDKYKNKPLNKKNIK